MIASKASRPPHRRPAARHLAVRRRHRRRGTALHRAGPGRPRPAFRPAGVAGQPHRRVRAARHRPCRQQGRQLGAAAVAGRSRRRPIRARRRRPRRHAGALVGRRPRLVRHLRSRRLGPGVAPAPRGRPAGAGHAPRHRRVQLPSRPRRHAPRGVAGGVSGHGFSRRHQGAAGPAEGGPRGRHGVRPPVRPALGPVGGWHPQPPVRAGARWRRSRHRAAGSADEEHRRRHPVQAVRRRRRLRHQPRRRQRVLFRPRGRQDRTLEHQLRHLPLAHGRRVAAARPVPRQPGHRRRAGGVAGRHHAGLARDEAPGLRGRPLRRDGDGPPHRRRARGRPALGPLGADAAVVEGQPHPVRHRGGAGAIQAFRARRRLGPTSPP